MKQVGCLMRLCACLLVATSADAGDPRIEQVELGLLPTAALKIGVSASIEDRMHAYGVPGLSVAVIERGKIAWARGYGLADVAAKRPVATDTLFQAASISKPISALAVMLLAQQGRLRLDEPVNEAMRSWSIPDNALSPGQSVTVRMLLNHTAGLAHANTDAYTPFAERDRVPTILQVLKGEPPARREGVTIVSPPGQSFAYSAAGYEVLQQLLEEITGRPFARYMRADVLQPFGMIHSTFAQPLPANLRARSATGYLAGGAPLPGGANVIPELAVAGLWSTPTDLANYILNVQQSLAGGTHGPLEPAMARQMLEPGLANRGLGPAISGSGRSVRFGHDGFNEGFESSLVAYEREGRGAVVMANSGFAFMLIKEVLQSIARAYQWTDYGFTNQEPPSASMGQQQVKQIPAEMLAKIPGRYESGEIHITLQSERGRLLLNSPHNGIAEVFMAPDGRLFCAPLIFADFGSPWLRLVEHQGRVMRILGGDRGEITLSRVR